jgi:DnaJ-class molecular chaperone
MAKVTPFRDPRKCDMCNGTGSIPAPDPRKGEQTCPSCGGIGEHR